MKILLISDTHNSKAVLKDKVLPKHAGEIDMAIHLGDYARDMMYLQDRYARINFVGVGGSFEFGEETEQILEVGAGTDMRKILLTHGHRQDVKAGLSRLVYYAASKQVDACFFGHTHEPVIFTESGIFFMNPGSLTQPRGSGPGSYGLVTVLPDGKFVGEVVMQ